MTDSFAAVAMRESVFSYTKKCFCICVLESFYAFFMEKTRGYGTIIINESIMGTKKDEFFCRYSVEIFMIIAEYLKMGRQGD